MSQSPDLFEGIRQSRLSVIVPVFNEAEKIVANLKLLISEIEPYFSTYEVLVISDGSTDGTEAAVRAFNHPRVKLNESRPNRGKGYSVREGFRAATGEYVLFIDGGMELHPKEIRIFLGLMGLYQADIVLGSKRHPQSRIDYPVVRRILSFTYQMLIKRFFGLDVTDTQVGIKLFRRAVVDAILPELRVDRYGFDLEILALAKQKGFETFLEAPIRLDYFAYNDRNFVAEMAHVGRVGLTVMADTIALYRRIRKAQAK